MIRLPVKGKLSSFKFQFLAVVSTLFPPLAYSKMGRDYFFWFPWILLIGGNILSLWGYLSLGKSFGVTPAFRKRVSTGAYRFFNHPIYIGQFITELGFVLMVFSLRNVIVLIIGTLLLTFRALEENRVLNSQKF